jgi:hypothetical protein
MCSVPATECLPWVDADAGGNGVTIYGWAPGIDDYAFPAEAGLRVGEGGYKSILMQTHFNTPVSGVGENSLTDASGITMFITNAMRANDIGVMSLGDPSVALQNVSPNLPPGRSAYAFECSSDFTSKHWEHPITVFGSTLHMHGSGLKMQTRRYAAGSGAAEVVNNVEFYDYNFQSVEPRDYVLNPGDKLVTECFFYSKPDQKWGLATDAEMCIDFVYYYPALTGLGTPGESNCMSGTDCQGTCFVKNATSHLGSFTYQEFGADADIGRSFGATAVTSESPPFPLDPRPCTPCERAPFASRTPSSQSLPHA